MTLPAKFTQSAHKEHFWLKTLHVLVKLKRLNEKVFAKTIAIFEVHTITVPFLSSIQYNDNEKIESLFYFKYFVLLRI